MKIALLRAGFCISLLSIVVAGCRKKATTIGNADLDTAADKFTAASSALVVPPPAAGDNSTPPAPSGPALATEMTQAVQSYKGGQFEDAVTRLQKLRAQPRLTAQQQMALNDATASVMADIYALAAKGDQRAVQAVKQYEKMQTQRR